MNLNFSLIIFYFFLLGIIFHMFGTHKFSPQKENEKLYEVMI